MTIFMELHILVSSHVHVQLTCKISYQIYLWQYKLIDAATLFTGNYHNTCNLLYIGHIHVCNYTLQYRYSMLIIQGSQRK